MSPVPPVLARQSAGQALPVPALGIRPAHLYAGGTDTLSGPPISDCRFLAERQGRSRTSCSGDLRAAGRR
jgi:hypothetical protein